MDKNSHFRKRMTSGQMPGDLVSFSLLIVIFVLCPGGLFGFSEPRRA
jgi:hypothetical protein